MESAVSIIKDPLWVENFFFFLLFTIIPLNTLPRQNENKKKCWFMCEYLNILCMSLYVYLFYRHTITACSKISMYIAIQHIQMQNELVWLLGVPGYIFFEPDLNQMYRCFQSVIPTSIDVINYLIKKTIFVDFLVEANIGQNVILLHHMIKEKKIISPEPCSEQENIAFS